MTDSRLCTRAVRAGIESDTQHGAVVPPLHLSTNYAFEGFGRKRSFGDRPDRGDRPFGDKPRGESPIGGPAVQPRERLDD